MDCGSAQMIDSQTIEHLSKRNDRIEDKVDKIAEDLSDLRVDLAGLSISVKRLGGIGTRIGKMEKWMWLITGAGITVGVLISKLIEVFFGK